VERRAAEGRPPGIDELVDVSVRPLDEPAGNPRGGSLVHLLTRIVLRRRELPFDARRFGCAPWRELLSSARPELSQREVGHCWHMTFGVLLQVYGEPQAATAELGRTPCPPAESVVSFIATGLKAHPSNDS
jgi:hypothetical protein